MALKSPWFSDESCGMKKNQVSKSAKCLRCVSSGESGSLRGTTSASPSTAGRKDLSSRGKWPVRRLVCSKVTKLGNSTKNRMTSYFQFMIFFTNTSLACDWRGSDNKELYMCLSWWHILYSRMTNWLVTKLILCIHDKINDYCVIANDSYPAVSVTPTEFFGTRIRGSHERDGDGDGGNDYFPGIIRAQFSNWVNESGSSPC